MVTINNGGTVRAGEMFTVTSEQGGLSNVNEVKLAGVQCQNLSVKSDTELSAFAPDAGITYGTGYELELVVPV